LPRALLPGVLRAILAAALLLPAAAAADAALWKLLQGGGQVVLIRHALTDPGVGDPPGFLLADCRTQRNLSGAGREEARRLGRAFRARAIPVARVLSSPWCRCIETAQLAFGGSQTEPALANLFGRGENRERQLAAFRKLVAAAPKEGNLVLVTHGSTTLAFTGVSPGTAEMVIVTPEGGGAHRLAGRLAVPD
jgi:broad specificity phosphatase PhoE